MGGNPGISAIPALILAGGMGTRLRPVVGDVPKPLADIAGRPFLHWLLRSLGHQGIREVYLSVGYRHEVLMDALGCGFEGLRLHYIIEHEPLGTGGAILYALQQIPHEHVLVLNGDTFAVLDLDHFVATAIGEEADLAISLAHVPDAGRYGTVAIDQDGRIEAFVEKGCIGAGWINAGVYVFHRDCLAGLTLPAAFSLEQDFMSPYRSRLRMIGMPVIRDFIDIGVPYDYALAQTKIPELFLARGRS